MENMSISSDHSPSNVAIENEISWKQKSPDQRAKGTSQKWLYSEL